MRSLSLLAGAAALLIAAPALADKGGKGGGGGQAKIEQVGGKAAARTERRAERRVERRAERRQERAERRPERRVERRADRKVERRADRREARADRRVERRVDRRERVADRRDARVARPVDRREPVRLVRDDRRERGLDRRPDLREVRYDRFDDRQRFRYADNADRHFRCPPGLAAKNNGCLPPGQAKKLVGQALPAAFAASLLPSYYRSWYPDTDDYYFRAGDDYIYRIDRDDGRVDGFMPLFDYADYEPDYYYVGERYPLDYVSFPNVPVAYQRYYADQGDWMYRYGDGAIYRVDRSSGLIDAIVQLLAGDLAVGSRLPAGYDVYNVPYAYRSRYYDTPDNWYRYNDGYIYQVDPQTRLIEAVIQAIA